jgi:LAS superfamily LD-carboxypeptidase LdcB
MWRAGFAVAVGAAVVVAVAAGAHVVHTTDHPAGPAVWDDFTAGPIALRFAYPPDWQVRQLHTYLVTVEKSPGRVVIEPAPNPERLSPADWAAQAEGLAEGLAEWEVTERTVDGAPAVVLARPGERRVFVARFDYIYQVTWHGDGERFVRWLGTIEFLDPGRAALTPDPSGTTPPAPAPRARPPEASPQLPQPQPQRQPEPERGLREFTAAQFVALFYEVNQPNLAPITSPPPITGDATADQRIVSIAQGRGYRLQATPTGAMSTVDGRPAQPLAAEAWRALAAAAAADGITMEVISAYRSIDDQRAIFLRRLDEAGPFTVDQIAAGEADGAIDSILQTSSIPGYSKHHTGYAVDVRDVDSGLPFTRFGETAAYQWMSANNFANAKRFGFVPSYPHGVEQQGPMPEEWEFVWVGTDPLHH